MKINRHRYGTSAKVALSAVFAALVFVVTSQVPPIPIPATGGYFNIGETTTIAALLFDSSAPSQAGSALYPMGFGVFAPGTLAIKGTEGAIVGFLNIKLRNRIKNTTTCAIIAVVVGGLEMVLGYFLYEQIVLGYPFAAALAEVPLNLGQMLVGLVIAIPIMHAVLRVFPQLKSQF